MIASYEKVNLLITTMPDFSNDSYNNATIVLDAVTTVTKIVVYWITDINEVTNHKL